MGMVHDLPPNNRTMHTWVVSEVDINWNIPWGFFYGASQGTPSRDGAGGIIFFSPTQWFKFAASIGFSTSNRAELLAMKFLLHAAIVRDIKNL